MDKKIKFTPFFTVSLCANLQNGFAVWLKGAHSDHVFTVHSLCHCVSMCIDTVTQWRTVLFNSLCAPQRHTAKCFQPLAHSDTVKNGLKGVKVFSHPNELKSPKSTSP
jgi:hypothetical protein